MTTAGNADSIETFRIPMALPEADSIAVDSLMADSLQADSIVLTGETLSGLIMESPEIHNEAPVSPDTGMSWIYLVLILLFCGVGLRLRNSWRYIRAILNDLTDTRTRNNVFDDTVSETSFLVLLNLLWIACVGVLLWEVINLNPGNEWDSLRVPHARAEGIGLCIGVTAAYTGLMILAYWIAGNVFTDRIRAESWLKGASASSALETIVLYPVALLLLTCPQWNIELLIIGGIAFIIGKIVFIFKGFRIFFKKFTSWLLFLYYLCSLEIVPLILTYVGTMVLCSVLL